MTDYEAFIAYLAVKSHFSSSYDYFKYNGKVKTSQKHFEQRNDKYYFKKLANKYKDPVPFLAVNFAYSPKFWIGQAFQKQSETLYTNQQSQLKSISYLHQQALTKILEQYETDGFKVLDNEHPAVFRLFLSNQISLELLIVLLDSTQTFDYWSSSMNDTQWKQTRNVIEKYRPFLDYDRTKIRKNAAEILKKYLSSE